MLWAVDCPFIILVSSFPQRPPHHHQRIPRHQHRAGRGIEIRAALLAHDGDGEQSACGFGFDLGYAFVSQRRIDSNLEFFHIEPQLAEMMLKLDTRLRLRTEQLASIWMQDEMCNAVRADVRREHHAVRAGLQKLALGGWNLAAGDDLDAWVHVSSAERDEDVRGIVGQDGGQHTATGDAGGVQNRLIGGWAFRLSGAPPSAKRVPEALA